MKRKTISLAFLSSLFLVAGCGTQPTTSTTTPTPSVSEETSPTSSPEETSQESPSLPTVENWDEVDLGLMRQHLDGNLVPYVTIDGASWTYIEAADALVYSAQNIDYDVVTEYIESMTAKGYTDESESYVEVAGRTILENHYDLDNTFNYIQCQVGIVGPENEYLTSGSGFFMAAFFLNQAVTEWDETRINQDTASLAETSLSLPKLPSRDEIKHIEILDDYLIFKIFQVTVYGYDAVTEYRTLLEDDGWTILEDSTSTYLAYDSNKKVLLDASYNTEENATIFIVKRYVETYVTWPAEKIAEYLVSMGIDNATIPEPQFNFSRISYEMQYVDSDQGSKNDSLIIYANGGSDSASYKDTLVASGWTLIGEFLNSYELKNPAGTCAIFISQEEYSTSIEIYPYVDPTIFPSDDVATMMDDLGLSSVTIPAITSDVTYSIDYIEGDELFTLYVTGDNFIEDYADILRNANWEVHASQVGLTAFDSTNTAQISIHYSADDGYAEMEVRAMEEGSRTYPQTELNNIFTQNNFTITIPQCNGFYYQLYLDDLEYDGSIGLYVWTRDHTDLDNFEAALIADDWIATEYSYEKSGYRIEIYDSIDDTAGAISIFIYPPESA